MSSSKLARIHKQIDTYIRSLLESGHPTKNGDRKRLRFKTNFGFKTKFVESELLFECNFFRVRTFFGHNKNSRCEINFGSGKKFESKKN